jgi:hypothetical protein
VRLRLLTAACATALALAFPAGALAGKGSLSAHQQTVLHGIAAATWRFYSADVDPNTHLPLDNLGPGTTRGTYTSAANIGVYLWAVVAAHDLGLIDHARAGSLLGATLDEVFGLKRYDGFLYQWYDTNNGNVLLNPGQGDCTEVGGTSDNCSFVSAVDNGWYASGLIEVREAFPKLRGLADSLLDPMDFSIFYDTEPRRIATSMLRSAASTPGPCTAAITLAWGRPPTTSTRCTATPGSPCTWAWASIGCPATSGGGRGGHCLLRNARPIPTSPTRDSGRQKGIGTPIPTRSRARCSGSGRATTPIPARD